MLEWTTISTFKSVSIKPRTIPHCRVVLPGKSHQALSHSPLQSAATWWITSNLVQFPTAGCCHLVNLIQPRPIPHCRVLPPGESHQTSSNSPVQGAATWWITSNLIQFPSAGCCHLVNLIQPRPIPHCRVLQPGEFNGMITELLAVYARSLMTTATTVLP